MLRPVFLLSLLAFGIVLGGCSNLIDAAKVVVHGLPPAKLLPTYRKLALTIFAGPTVNTLPGSGKAKPLRVCIYISDDEDWVPPVDLNGPCAKKESQLLKVEEKTLGPDKVVQISTSIPFEKPAWLTITGDFAYRNDGKPMLKISSLPLADTCYWAKIDGNKIIQISHQGADNLSRCQ